MKPQRQRTRKDEQEKEIVSFTFAYYENVQRVVMAFALANHPVTVSQEAGRYQVNIERWKPLPPKRTNK